ncbi:pentatricopeptide repeat-containing protein At3g42630-like [Aristolochia californica]|uniref:pentatricopeptide repeat-containing protein At3g42630-like n=1 Tax=Aristolochia californica TaxID=171875 RepID=UPI0035DEEC19
MAISMPNKLDLCSFPLECWAKKRSLLVARCAPLQQSIEEIIRQWEPQRRGAGIPTHVELTRLISFLGKNKMPELAHQLFLEIQSKEVEPSSDTLSALMVCYACNGLFSQSRAIWDEILNSSYVPGLGVIRDLMDAYGKMDRFHEMSQVMHEVASRYPELCSKVYPLAILCFGECGQLEFMEYAMKEMISSGFKVDSTTGNAFVRYYSLYGTFTEVEAAYFRLKRSRILIEKETIRAMALAYIKERRFYKLGEFLRDVGLSRKNTGNLLWNLLLLSYAANFKMKSLQREFLNMVGSGFSPDLTTFNIRALAFSRMSMFWDLHLSLEHMRHEKVSPDLVTYGCVVDTYLDRRLGRNLSFALERMDPNTVPVISTDPIVFEVFGKGDFHSTSEVLLESNVKKEWTYSKLIRKYLKKQFRANLIFWNY